MRLLLTIWGYCLLVALVQYFYNNQRRSLAQFVPEHILGDSATWMLVALLLYYVIQTPGGSVGTAPDQ